MGQHFARIEHTFFNECQTQLSQLDDILLGLASSIDSIHTAANLLLSELGNISWMPECCTQDMNKSIERNIQLTKDLLFSVESGLNHQKMSVLQEFCQLKRLVKSKCRDQTLTTLPALKNLKVDDYIKDFQEKEKQKLLLSSGEKNSEHFVTNGDHKDAKLDEEREQIIQSLRKEIEAITAKKETETGNYKKMNEEVQRLLTIKAELEEKNAMLETQQKRSEIVPVQLYYQHGSDQMAAVVQDIMSLLNTQEQFGDRKVACIRCEKAEQAHSNIPLLALCMNTSRIGTDAKIAIQGIQDLKNTALLIFHHKDEHALPKQTSDRVLTSPEFQALGGIYDMAFLSGRGIYSCETNTEATYSIVTFIEKALKRQF